MDSNNATMDKGELMTVERRRNIPDTQGKDRCAPGGAACLGLDGAEGHLEMREGQSGHMPA